MRRDSTGAKVACWAGAVLLSQVAAVLLLSAISSFLDGEFNTGVLLAFLMYGVAIFAVCVARIPYGQSGPVTPQARTHAPSPGLPNRSHSTSWSISFVDGGSGGDSGGGGDGGGGGAAETNDLRCRHPGRRPAATTRSGRGPARPDLRPQPYGVIRPRRSDSDSSPRPLP
jgi:hypothetical protein